MIKKTITKLFLRFIDFDLLMGLYELKRRNSALGNCSAEAGAKLYSESRIINLQKNNSKISIGEGSQIKGELLVFASGGLIEVGNNSFVGEGTRVWSAEHVNIGNNVLISHNCNIIDTNSHELDHLERAKSFKSLVRSGHPKTMNAVLSKPIIIHDYAWINFNVSILKGVTIGKGAIIGSGSVVTKDIPPFTFSAGNPARVIKFLI